MTKKRRRFPFKPELTYEDFLKKLESYKQNLCSSAFYDKIRESLQTCLKGLEVDKIDQIVCYGLGKFTECLISKYQLALLLLLKSHFDAEVHIYDPVFSSVEIEYLNNLQLSVIDRNEEGARNVLSPSLFYMPHCPSPLVNNLLWHNWSPQISNCIVLGNSFQSICALHPESELRKRFFYINSILPHMKELPIANIFTYTDIFNDMSLHYFPSLPSSLPQVFWQNKTKPEYADTDIFVECISNRLKDSKIEDEKSDETVENDKNGM